MYLHKTSAAIFTYASSCSKVDPVFLGKSTHPMMKISLKNSLKRMFSMLDSFLDRQHAKPKTTIDSLIGVEIKIDGNIRFSGGLRLDGEINGEIAALPGKPSMLVLGAQGRVNGKIIGPHLVLNGMVNGSICAEYLELESQARIIGNVHYKFIEIQSGAIVEAKLTHILDVVSDKIVTFKLKSVAE